MRRSEEEWEVHRFPLEAKLQDFIMRRLRAYKKKHSGAYIKAFKAADRHTVGISDVLLCVCGTFVAVELKVGSNTPTLLQEVFIDEIKKAGGVGGVAYTWGEFKEIVNGVLQQHKAPVL